MAKLTLDATTQPIATAAHVSEADLNGNNAVAAADKLLKEALTESISGQALQEIEVLDAEAYGAQHGTDTFANYTAHLSSALGSAYTSSVQKDFTALPGNADAIGKSMEDLANALAAAYPSTATGVTPSGTPSAAGLGAMTVSSFMFNHNAVWHNENEATTQAGDYSISYEQRNSASNILTIKDASGKTVDLPDSMKNGGAGSFTLPNGAVVTVSGSGKEAKFSVAYQGSTEETDFHGAGEKGSYSTTTSMAAPAPTPSAGTESVTSYVPEGITYTSPTWVASQTVSLADAYNDDTLAALFNAGTADGWGSEFNHFNYHHSAVSESSLTGDQLAAYEAGIKFAATYRGGDDPNAPATPTSTTPSA